MRISKIIFVIGLVFLIIGILIAIAIPASVTWEPKTKALCTNEILNTSEIRNYDYYRPYFAFIISFGETKDFEVEGSIEEVSNYTFNFYIFNETNYNLWEADRAYDSYFEAENITSTAFSFTLSNKDSVSELYFLVENPEPYRSDRVAKLTATVHWEEKATLSGILGGLILGGIIALIGVILIIVGGIATLVFKPKSLKARPPKPPELKPETRICPHCGKTSSPDAKFCSYCGKALE